MTIQGQSIASLFTHDIHRRIEEVVKVEQTNESIVAAEMREYVVTEKIQEAYRSLLDRYLETPQKPHEGIGIWISGFFGSGKSSFAKVLGYILQNRQVEGDSAIDLFLQRLPGAGAAELTVLLRRIAQEIPSETVIFDVSTNRSVKSGSEKITGLMYRNFLKELGYAEDFSLAELEINLESEGKLAQFEQRYEELYAKPWSKGRGLLAVAINQASRVLHDLDPATYSEPDSWAKTFLKVDIDTDPNRFAKRVFDLMKRRRSGKTILFVIDEVGRYVANSTDKLLDLQGVVQALGAQGRGKAWVAVTSQERLDEIVSSLDRTRIELAILRDRFPLQVDLVASDIAEVTSTRVLAKKAGVVADLISLYEGVKGQLATFTKMEKTARYPELSPQGFARFYPFLPYQMDLIVEVISGLRLQAGGSTHTGGSSRTIIKLAQQVVVDPHIGLGAQPVGALVTLDQIYDLIQQFVAPERRQDIERIERDYPANEKPLVAKVAKVICLLQQVKNVKRSAATLAAVLHPAANAPSLAPAIEDALNELKAGQWIEEGEHGYQLLSPQGKQWAQERRNLADPREGERIRYQKELLEELLRNWKSYRHKGHRTFQSAVNYKGEQLGSGGDIEVELRLVAGEDWETERQQTQENSRETQRILWVAPLPDRLQRELEEYHRSKLMLDRYKREAKDRGLQEQVEAETRRLEGHKTNVKNALEHALMAGETYFKGYRREAAILSDHLTDVLSAVFAQVVPELYPKFDLAAFRVEGSTITRMIEDKSLGALPEVCFAGPRGLGLVIKEGGTAKPNTASEIALEVFSFIERQHRPPERVTGKMILDHFRGLVYGWDDEPIRLTVATLLRAGLLEINADGRRIQSHADPGAREVYATLPAFRSATFAPKSGGVTWDELVSAAEEAEKIFGESVEMESAAVTAEGIKRLAAQQPTFIHRVATRLIQAGLPGEERLEEHLALLRNIAKNGTDDLIKSFLAEGAQLRSGHERAVRLDQSLNNQTSDEINRARLALRVAWGSLQDRPEGETVREAAARLRENLRSEQWYEFFPVIKTDAASLAKAYLSLYQQVWEKRGTVYRQAIEIVKGHGKWTELNDVQQKNVLRHLQARVGETPNWTAQKLPENPTLLEMEAHIEGVEKVTSNGLLEIEELTAPQEKIEHVQVSKYLTGAFESTEGLQEALDRLRDDCAKLLATGAKLFLK